MLGWCKDECLDECQMGECLDGRKDGWMRNHESQDAWMNVRMNAWMNARMNAWMNGNMNAWKKVRMICLDGCKDECLGECNHECQDECKDGWMQSWILDGCKDDCKDECLDYLVSKYSRLDWLIAPMGLLKSLNKIIYYK